MASPAHGARALHWVFKIGSRTETVAFLRTLGFGALRHEEFEEGCDAACNGPYDGKWSKTMVGTADEDITFVLELTYNYPIHRYARGNEFKHVLVKNAGAFKRAKAMPDAKEGPIPGSLEVLSPDGYPFVVVDGQEQAQGPIAEINLACTDLEKTIAYWGPSCLGFEVRREGKDQAVVVPGLGQCVLRFHQLPAGTALDRVEAYGRIAFSAPDANLKSIQAHVEKTGYTIHTPYISLDTPGKATVQVVILADPDGHEICFVGDDGFRDLSKVDPEADKLLEEAIAKDGSDVWFKKEEAKRAQWAA